MGCLKKSRQDDPSMARRLSHQMSCSFSLGLAGQWTGVDIIRSETKALSRLKLSQFYQDLNPHLNVIFRPGHGILSRYWNSHFSGTMERHPHHDNIKWVGLGQWILILYYLSRTVHYPHPVQSLDWTANIGRVKSQYTSPGCYKNVLYYYTAIRYGLEVAVSTLNICQK